MNKACNNNLQMLHASYVTQSISAADTFTCSDNSVNTRRHMMFSNPHRPSCKTQLNLECSSTVT